MLKRIGGIAVMLLMSACTVFPQATQQQAVHRFRLDPDLEALTPVPQVPPITLEVARPDAYPGFRSRAIRYIQRTSQLDAYAWHEWIEPLDEQLQRILIDALERRRVAAVVQDVTPEAPAPLRLDSELLYLQQDLRQEPPQLQLALRVRLLDLEAGQVLASRLFRSAEPMAAQDPYSGVAASNRALGKLLAPVTDFVRQAVQQRAETVVP